MKVEQKNLNSAIASLAIGDVICGMAESRCFTVVLDVSDQGVLLSELCDPENPICLPNRMGRVMWSDSKQAIINIDAEVVSFLVPPFQINHGDEKELALECREIFLEDHVIMPESNIEEICHTYNRKLGILRAIWYDSGADLITQLARSAKCLNGLDYFEASVLLFFAFSNLTPENISAGSIPMNQIMGMITRVCPYAITFNISFVLEFKNACVVCEDDRFCPVKRLQNKSSE